MSTLSSCYNTLGFVRWEELCHEFMVSVLPMDDPRMSVDDLSSPTWRIIFLKDDCFLQPSCEVTSSSSDPDPSTNTIISTTTVHYHHYEEELDHHTIPSSPSSMIEPLFDEIDLNHQQQYQHTQRNNGTQHPTSTESIELNQILSPSLSRSSSVSFSDVDDQIPNQPSGSRASPKSTRHQRKRKRQSKTTTKLQERNHKQRRVHKHSKHHHTAPTTTTTSAPISTMATRKTTLFDQLSLADINWCRYCGTTEGVNWRPGPWGKRTLCNKHGCDYKGYGLASRLPRLDLSGYRHELMEDRHRPVIQEFCSICQERGSPSGYQHPLQQYQNRHSHQQQKGTINKTIGNREKGDSEDNDTGGDDSSKEFIACDGGCSRAFHRQCFDIDSRTWVEQDEGISLWFCSPSCSENRRKKRVVVDLPRKQPLMRHLKKD